MRRNSVFSLVLSGATALALLSGCAAFRKGVPVDSKLGKAVSEIEARHKENQKADLYLMILEAEDAVIRGDIDRARAAYKALAKLDENNPDVHRTLAEIYVHDGDFKTALLHASRAYSLDPKDPRNSVLLAGLYAALGRLDESIRLYREIVARIPDDEEIPLLLASLLLVKKDFSEAREVLKEYIRRHPDSAVGYFESARLELVKDNNCKAARPYLDKAMEIEPRFSRAELAIGFCEEQGGDSTRAIEHYERALGLDPENVVLRNYLVRMHLRSDNLDEATRQNEKLQLFAFDEMDIRLNRGLILYREGRFAEAIKEFNLILATEPENGQALHFLALCQTRLNNFEEALKTYARIPQKSGLYLDSIMGRGIILRRLGRLSEAEELLKNALLISPDDPYLLRTLSLVVADRGDAGGAVKMMEKAVKLTPDDPDMIYNLANILERAGRWREGLTIMEEVLKKDPKNADAMNYIGYTFLEHDENLDRASELLRQAAEMRPLDGYILDSYGWALYKRGRFQEALVQLEKALSLVPDESVVAEHIGDCCLKLGDKGKALEHYKLALNLHPEKDQIERLKKKVSDLEK